MTASAPVALPYHRLAREPRLRNKRYAGWKPAVEIVIVLALFVVLQAVFAAAYYIIGRQNESDSTWISDFFVPGPRSGPAALVYLFGSVASTGVGALIAARMMGRKPGALWSVAGRIRWRILWISLAAITLPVFFCYVLDVWIAGSVPAPIDKNFWLSTLILISLVPLQCTAEELIFRGSLPQALGAWIRSPLLPYALAIPVFVFSHGYDALGLVGVALYTTVASVLVHRTGGLEVAIVLHTTNNMSLTYAEFAGLMGEADNLDRIEFIIAAFVVQYLSAFLLLILLRRYAPARSEASAHVAALPGWYPGAGWVRGWPPTKALRQVSFTPHPLTAPRQMPPGAR